MSKKIAAVLATVALAAIIVPNAAFAVASTSGNVEGSAGVAQRCEPLCLGACGQSGACVVDAVNAAACAAYVDQDGDGVCDNREAATSGAGQALCSGYIDDDSDGVCDRRQSGECNGCQRGKRA